MLLLGIRRMAFSLDVYGVEKYAVKVQDGVECDMHTVGSIVCFSRAEGMLPV